MTAAQLTDENQQNKSTGEDLSHIKATMDDPAQKEISNRELLWMALDLQQSIVQQSVYVSSSTTNVVQKGLAFDLAVLVGANMAWPSF